MRTPKSTNHMKKIYGLLAWLAGMTVSLSASAYDFEVDGIYYNILSIPEAKVEVTYREYTNYKYESGYEGDMVLPSTVTLNSRVFTVTRIGENAFYQNEKLISIQLPEHLESIGTNAFYECDHLTGINLPSELTSIESSAFYGCKQITYLKIPKSVMTIGQWGFLDCGILELYIEDSDEKLEISGYNYLTFANIPIVTGYIGRNLDGPRFSSKTLTSLTFGDKVTRVSDVTNYYNGESNNFTTLNLGANVEEIEGSAFSNASKLQTLVLPDKLTKIGESAFSGCSALNNITMGRNVKEIKAEAFANCKAINTITVQMAEPAAFSQDVFDNIIYATAALYVPSGTTGLYQSTAYWSNFFAVQEGTPTETQKWLMTASGGEHGKVMFGGKVVENVTTSKIVDDGSEVIFSIVPDFGYQVASLRLNGEDVTDQLNGLTFTLESMTRDNTLSVTFEETPVWLTINNAESGSVVERVRMGQKYTYQILPAEGYKVHIVSFNGEGVTEQLDEDGCFTTPYLTGNSTLSVVYESTATDVKASLAPDLRIYPVGESLKIENAVAGQTLSICTLSGAVVRNEMLSSTSASIALPTGQTYVVSTCGRTVKVRL